MTPRMNATLFVSAAVGLNLISALVLKETADMKDGSMAAIGAALLIVILLNLSRVGCWAAIHKRFQLSDSYPLTSLFFPMILIASASYGEEINAPKMIGTLLITLGVVVLVTDKSPQSSTAVTDGSSHE